MSRLRDSFDAHTIRVGRHQFALIDRLARQLRISRGDVVRRALELFVADIAPEDNPADDVQPTEIEWDAFEELQEVGR